jgi:hypothetical protein
MRCDIDGAHAIDLEVASPREYAGDGLPRCHHRDELVSIEDRRTEHPADRRFAVAVVFGDELFCIRELDLLNMESIIERPVDRVVFDNDVLHPDACLAQHPPAPLLAGGE